MKRILSLVLVCVLLLGSMFALASCSSMITGEYSDKLGLTTYEFSLFNKVKITYSIVGQHTIEGTYKITENGEGDKEITFTFADDVEDADDYKGTFNFSTGTEDDEEYIKIGLFKYYKK